MPNFVNKDLQKRGDFRLEPGLVLAIEPMVNMGRPDVRTLDDHWTVVTQDGMPSVHFEHTAGDDGRRGGGGDGRRGGPRAGEIVAETSALRGRPGC